MLEEQRYRCNSIEILIIAGLVDIVAKFENEPRLTDTNTLFSELVVPLRYEWMLIDIQDERMSWLKNLEGDFESKTKVFQKITASVGC